VEDRKGRFDDKIEVRGKIADALKRAVGCGPRIPFRQLF
jgi:hypothetical protein